MDEREYFRASKARTQRGLISLTIALDTAIVDRVINSPGTLFYLDKSSTGICTVEGSVDQGTTGDTLLASAGFSLFNENGFSGFRISAPAQAGKVLKVVIASGVSIKPGDAVVSGALGTQTVDAGLVRTLNNQAFYGAANNSAPVAGQNPSVSLWNPAASGKNVIVESVTMTTSTAQIMVMGDTTTALANAMAAGSLESKLSAGLVGAAVGVGQMRYTNQAGASIINSPYQIQLSANTPHKVDFKEPLVFTPGRGLLVYGVTVNTYIACNFEWFEQ